MFRMNIFAARLQNRLIQCFGDYAILDQEQHRSANDGGLAHLVER